MKPISKQFIGFFIAFTMIISDLIAANTLIRYNSDLTDSEIQTDFNCYGTLRQAWNDPVEATARGDAGWGYQSPNITIITGDSAYIESKEEISTSYFGNHSISGELWMKPSSYDAALFSWGDSAAADHICFYLKEGKFYLHRKAAGYHYIVSSETIVDTSRFSFVTCLSKTVGDSLELAIWVNGEKVAGNKDLTFIGLVAFNSKAVFGKSMCSMNNMPNFKGEIYSVALNNFIRANDFLKASPTFDGSEFLGMPIFPERGYEKSISSSKTSISNTAFIPYLNDYYIPQGLTCSWEDPEFDGTDPMVYLTMYHKTIDGEIGEKNSILVEMDPLNHYKVRRCFKLMGDDLDIGHTGSAAYQNGWIYIGSGGVIYQLRLPEYDSEQDKYLELEYEKSYSLNYSATLNFHNDSLWTGRYVASGTDGNAYVMGYPVDEEGNIVTNVAAKIYRIPIDNQGAAWATYKGKDYLFVSSSYGGSNNSLLYRFSRENLQRTTIAEPDTIFELPSGTEDITFLKNGNMLHSSESGSRTYQLRTYYSSWSQYYPFLFEINPSVYFKGIKDDSTAIEQSDVIISEFCLNTYPNPFNNSMTIEYSLPLSGNVELIVYNILGQELNTIRQKRTKAGNYRINWQADNLSSGIYFLRFSVDGLHSEMKKITYLK